MMNFFNDMQPLAGGMQSPGQPQQQQFMNPQQANQMYGSSPQMDMMRRMAMVNAMKGKSQSGASGLGGGIGKLLGGIGGGGGGDSGGADVSI